MIDVPFTGEAESIAYRRYEDAQRRRERKATTPDEYARRAQACVGVEARIADPPGTDYAALPLHAWRGAYAALLAGDRDRARALADAVWRAEQSPEPGIRLDDHPYHYASAVAAAAAGNDEAVRDALAGADPTNEWTEASTTALRGAVEGDRTAFESALNELLEAAHEQAEQGSEMDVRSIVFAAEPTALTLLAWDRGMSYDPDSRLVPSEYLWETLPKLRD